MAKAKVMKSVFTHIRSLREDTNQKQTTFADKINVNRKYYSKMEARGVNCCLENLFVISAYLDTTPWAILEEAVGKDWHKIAKEITGKPGEKWQ